MRGKTATDFTDYSGWHGGPPAHALRFFRSALNTHTAYPPPFSNPTYEITDLLTTHRDRNNLDGETCPRVARRTELMGCVPQPGSQPNMSGVLVLIAMPLQTMHHWWNGERRTDQSNRQVHCTKPRHAAHDCGDSICSHNKPACGLEILRNYLDFQ